MPYNLHIILTDHWMDAGDDLITKEEVDALIESDPELAWSTNHWEDVEDEKGRVVREYAILWNGEPAFCYNGSEVIMRAGDDRNQLLKFVRMAVALEAYCVGDDGEQYKLDRSWLLGDRVDVVPP
jgi:hypothetical protein